ncbi:HORMA domain-containing protein 1 [Syngnathus acus]|uniref:HORMA domain-containing protein 1 n=1 Tax=Syngnathus acus TaxID=161584 RepID=UPI0018861560|nr:HORMA domain-containing protein 1 [Syngnathus acus]
MTCVQQIRTSKNTHLMPNQVVSEQQSITVIKNLLAIGVSGIMYLRGLFPEGAYGIKYFEDQRVMILREERSCPGACQLVKWIMGCFDAIQMKYLQTVIITVSSEPDNPQNVTEFYQFRIQYNTEGAQLDFASNENKDLAVSFGNTKKASMLLVRKLYLLLQNLGPLPNKAFLNMTLTYYDDVTPQDYQPPGFKDADDNMLVFEREPVSLTMGEVATPFHSLKLDMVTERHRLEPVEESTRKRNRWCLRLKRDGSLSQESLSEHVDNTPRNDKIDHEAQEIELTCHENTCEVERMETVVLKRTSDMETSTMTTRSGRVIQHTMQQRKATMSTRKQAPVKKNMVRQYNIPNSQEVPLKKRKFSESKKNV